MKAARCAPALCGGKPNDLAAGTASHRSNFLAARLNGTENPPKRPAIRRMSVEHSDAHRRLSMNQKICSPMMSRRRVMSLFGIVAGAAAIAATPLAASAQTSGMERRGDRRDTRQDCRQGNGAVGADKRNCKQDARQNPTQSQGSQQSAPPKQ